MKTRWFTVGEVEAPYVIQARVDFADYLEQFSSPPPVAFSNRSALDAWIDKAFTNPKFTFFGKKTQAFQVGGSIGGVSWFDQIWVPARYRSYRGIMKKVASASSDVKDISSLHADHIVARTTLRNNPDAWVALFPVYPSSNKGFGPLEKELPKLVADFGQADLSPIATFKIFNGRMPRSEIELELAMRDIRGQIRVTSAYVNDYLVQMEEAILKYIRSRRRANLP